MGKVIVIGSQKGGVGKTTTTLNLAYSLYSMGKKVLAIDFDSQANLTTCYGVENTNELEYTIGHLMMEWKDDGFKEHQEERDPVDVRISEKCETIENKLLKQIYAMFDKERFIDLIMNFVVFDKGIKKVCRYNQYFGIKRTEQRLNNLRTDLHNPNRDQNKPLGGILWHTQGSGKTLTMLIPFRQPASIMKYSSRWDLRSVRSYRPILQTRVNCARIPSVMKMILRHS